MKHVLLTWLMLLATCAAYAQQAQPTPNDPLTAAREVHLAKQLRCLVCQNETIADSRADLAQDLRARLREQIAAGKTDAEIIEYMTARYGDFVLYNPPLKATTWLLWFGPFVLLVIGALVAWRVIRARRSTLPPVPLSEEEHARAAALLERAAEPGPTESRR